MPYSIVHIELGVSLKDYFNNENDFLDFLAGSIFVDSSYELNNQGVQIKREDTHYHKGEDYINSEFPDNFLKKELKTNFSNFKLGYYYHLILDKLWRDSSFVGEAYKNNDLDEIYQLSRIFHANIDLNDFIKVDNNNYIDKLYKYKINKNSLPSVFLNIDTNILNDTYMSIIDYMVNKKTFKKVSNEDEVYTIINGELEFLDKEIEKKVNTLFPYKDYNDLKKQGLKILLTNIQNFKKIS
nr:hypothetical protein [Candidatus Gracilibacteria bacterium]